MSYAQTNYSQKQGVNGRYTIAQIGCFLTSFCNLLERFGEAIAPPNLDNYFKQHSFYIDVDDGIRDDLGWGSVSLYNSRIVVAGTGGAGWPTSNNSILKFYYQSIQNPWITVNGQRVKNMVTHFCLVGDVNARTIVDSWDGVTKAPNQYLAYGQPVAWASYAAVVPQPVTPPPVVVAPPVPVAPPTPLPVPEPPKVYNVHTVDGITYEVLIGGPKQMWVNRHDGLDKLTFENVKAWPDFRVERHLDYRTPVTVVGIAHHPVSPSGADFYMDAEDFGDFKQTGTVKHLAGYGYSSLSETEPAPLPVPEPAKPATPQVDELPEGITDWRPYPKPVKYVAMQDYYIPNLVGKSKTVGWKKYDELEFGGTFKKDGTTYLRPVPAIDAKTWFGVPNEAQYLMPYDMIYNLPATTAERKATHHTTLRDYIVLIYDRLTKLGDTIKAVRARSRTKTKNTNNKNKE